MSFINPEACTLPTTDRPSRLAEFDDLLATAVHRADLVGATRARLHLRGPAGLTTWVRDLTARESVCCSFFAFTVTVLRQPAAGGEAAILDIEVPPTHADVLAGLTERANAGTTC